MQNQNEENVQEQLVTQFSSAINRPVVTFETTLGPPSFLSPRSLFISNSSLPELEQKVYALINYYHSEYGTSYAIDWQELRKLITEIEGLVRASVISTYQQQLASQDNAYRHMISGLKNLHHQHYSEQTVRITQLEAELAALHKEAPNFRLRRYRSGSLLQSTDQLSLQAIKERYRILEESNLALAEKLSILTAKNQQLESSLAAAEEAVEQSIVNLALANSKVEGLEAARMAFQQQFRSWERCYLDELHISMKLSELIIRIEDVNRETFTELESELSHFKEELQNTQISLDISKKDSEQLQRANFSSKIKLASVLVLDSTRNFLPYSIGNYITKAETILLATEVSSTSSQVGWAVLVLFLVFSVLCAVAKLVSWARWGYQKLVHFWTSKEGVVTQQTTTEKNIRKEKTPQLKNKGRIKN